MDNRYTIARLLQVTAVIAIVCASFKLLPPPPGYENYQHPWAPFGMCLFGAAPMSFTIASLLHKFGSWHFLRSCAFLTFISSWLAYSVFCYVAYQWRDADPMSAIPLFLSTPIVSAMIAIPVSLFFRVRRQHVKH